MNAELSEIRELVEGLAGLPDGRPDWLKKLPSASDSTALYYRLFFELVRRKKPPAILEIGTYVGTSAAHFAAAHPGSFVVTLDHNPDAARQIDLLNLANVFAVTRNSGQGARDPAVRARAPYDILFIDANHTFNDAYGEYELYRPLVAEGGLIFFDDIRLDMKTKEMAVLWEMIPDPKLELSAAHYTGFGVAKKDPAVIVRRWAEIRDARTSSVGMVTTESGGADAEARVAATRQQARRDAMGRATILPPKVVVEAPGVGLLAPGSNRSPRLPRKIPVARAGTVAGHSGGAALVLHQLPGKPAGR